ncbi:hypothetical protein JR064_01610 [Xanthomonas sp. CFBP 8703]|uniref:Uncharacterized protein n=1 Tax=Xanthomonas bonasiae TaxID=2810351 RepID=A0ABS3AYF9_9XANT|nr:hypothetical protein [Xanthomonas bonasiae]MBN6100859.1 hypothetical protein [Xanthomonas bonasiae]
MFDNDRATATRPDVLPVAPRGSGTIATAHAACFIGAALRRPLLEGYRQTGKSPLIGRTTAEFSTHAHICAASMNTRRAFPRSVHAPQQEAWARLDTHAALVLCAVFRPRTDDEQLG